MIKKAKDSSYIGDFAAGIDPTGVNTFNNSLKNEKNHGAHKLVGNAGGFIGGASISAALAIGGTKGIGKGLQKWTKHKSFGKLLDRAGTDQMAIFQPKKAKKILSRVPEAIQQVKKEQGLVGAAQKDYKILKSEASKLPGSLKKNPIGTIDTNIGNAKKMKGDLKDGVSAIKTGIEYEAAHGENAARTMMRGAAIVGVGSGALLGGTLNATSAQAQYSSGQSHKRQLKKQAAGPHIMKLAPEVFKKARPRSGGFFTESFESIKNLPGATLNDAMQMERKGGAIVMPSSATRKTKRHETIHWIQARKAKKKRAAADASRAKLNPANKAEWEARPTSKKIKSIGAAIGNIAKTLPLAIGQKVAPKTTTLAYHTGISLSHEIGAYRKMTPKADMPKTIGGKLKRFGDIVSGVRYSTGSTYNQIKAQL